MRIRKNQQSSDGVAFRRNRGRRILSGKHNTSHVRDFVFSGTVGRIRDVLSLIYSHPDCRYPLIERIRNEIRSRKYRVRSEAVAEKILCEIGREIFVESPSHE
jgi:hypothetical protein